MEDWKSFDQASACLPRELRIAAQALPRETREVCEELHLRAGRCLTWANQSGEFPVTVGDRPLQVTEGDLRMMVELATRSSFHTAVDQMRDGFVPLPGGHRLGICGTASVQNGKILAFRQISSLCLRIARARKGIGTGILPQLWQEGRLCSTLILSPPGKGKTTLLRELLRQISDGANGLRVGLADERGEVAAECDGVPQLDVGMRTDVEDGCRKSDGLRMLLRSMNPQLLAADEITASEDVQSITEAANCGVAIFATAHGGNVADLTMRPLYQTLMEQHIFRRLVTITVESGRRSYAVEPLE